MLEARNLQVRRGHRTILTGIDFSASPGEVTAIIGCNGAGKSTLLKALCGELKPSLGEVFVHGKSLGAWPERELAAIRAVVPQASALVFPFTVYEVVMLGRAPHSGGGHGAEDDAVVLWALQITELEEMAGRDYTTLSGGEKQRVHFARALAQIGRQTSGISRLLLLDEPTSNLDLAHQHHCLSTARTLALEGAAVVIVLHDLNLCRRYADKAFLLDGGHCAASGPVDAVMQPELLTKAYGIPIGWETDARSLVVL